MGNLNTLILNRAKAIYKSYKGVDRFTKETLITSYLRNTYTPK